MTYLDKPSYIALESRNGLGVQMIIEWTLLPPQLPIPLDLAVITFMLSWSNLDDTRNEPSLYCLIGKKLYLHYTTYMYFFHFGSHQNGYYNQDEVDIIFFDQTLWYT